MPPKGELIQTEVSPPEGETKDVAQGVAQLGMLVQKESQEVAVKKDEVPQVQGALQQTESQKGLSQGGAQQGTVSPQQRSQEDLTQGVAVRKSRVSQSQVVYPQSGLEGVSQGVSQSVSVEEAVYYGGPHAQPPPGTLPLPSFFSPFSSYSSSKPKHNLHYQLFGRNQ